MAARKRKLTLSDNWKDNIRAGVLAQRLYAAAIGEVEMSNQQIKAADIILKKLIPDLARTELTGKDGQDINLSLNVSFD
jgi:hypothetical protein